MTNKKTKLASSNSWLKIYRKFLKWEWYDDINVKVLFIHCLLKANYIDKKWHGIEIKRGTFITTIRGLAKETGLTPMQVRTALTKLKTTHEITQSSNANYTVISINNYNTYQTSNTLDNKPVTHQQHTDNTPITHTIEDIEVVEDIELSKDKAKPKPRQSTLPLKEKKQTYGSTDINVCTQYLQEKLGASLDGSVKENRQYCYNLLRKMKKDYPSTTPVDQIKMLIDVAMQDKFHSKNVTGFKYLYYNTQRIAQSFKSDYGIGSNNSDIQVI